ncbi:hypothetical protein GALMADRAFT_133643 [Galerina marginata CBS 339.88]|uniref:ubiquitinyl hydrolase 1 n=1 Tax=Galerina marginata (strain CBS 339.88) TaxID=685588 RepID=A0A067TM45_GALM3|nr:hypothetical protein GALMADRAFT_133643 [Galerina marginata CBS 339.88]
MHLQDVLKSTLFQQTAPLIVLFFIPAFVFFASRFLRQLSLDQLVLGWYRTLSMGLESLGFSWLWSGSSSQSSASGSHGKRHKRKSSGSTSKSKGVRTRADQISLKNVGKQSINDDTDSDSSDSQYYSGLVNISGTYCFMNSTLQALASLTYLQPYIDAIHDKAEALDVPTPVIDALQELFKNLNTAKSSYHSLRPHDIITALSTPPPQLPSGDKSTTLYRTSTSLFNSREHQDAQELFQLVSECIKNEMNSVEREGLRDRGIAGVLELARPSAKGDKDDPADLKSSKSVFDGLTANRRSCVVCGYTEAVMHFGFDNWQLAVPRLATSCRLEDCLEDYTRLEILKDCICRNCSMIATHRRLNQELKTLEEALGPPPPTPSVSGAPFSPSSPAASSSLMPSSSPSKPKPSVSKKKRYKEVKRMEERVKTAIAQGRIEDDALLEGVRLEKTVSPASTKQAMIARPPPVLALHLNRSVHYGQFAAKNTIRVYFPEVLDLTPYTTSGSLSTVPTSSISTPPPPPNQYATPEPQTQIPAFSAASNEGSTVSSRPKRPTTPTQETYAPGVQRTIYRLAAVVCHYGQHSFGHYICYRRKPRRIGGKWMPPTLMDPLRLEMDEDEEGDEEERQDSSAASQRSSKKANGVAVRSRTANYSGSSSLVGDPRYYWEDRTEEEVGTGRGWLRISDDAVSECGIESVLAEGTGAFMLYYEKAVHPHPGVYLRGRPSGNGKAQEVNGRDAKARSRSRTGVVNGRAQYGYGSEDGTTDQVGDGDSFSTGSEETLKPEMKVVDLNGSVGSLISEVGVGVMKTPKKEKDKNGRKEKEKKVERVDSMSMSAFLPSSSASSSTSFGPRIVRSVNARRRNTPDITTTTASSSSNSDSGATPGTSTAPSPSPKTNGSASHDLEYAETDQDLDDKILAEMTASAPSILASSSVANSALTSSTNQAPAKGQSYSRLGSKSTKVVHHPPAGMKVKAQ